MLFDALSCTDSLAYVDSFRFNSLTFTNRKHHQQVKSLLCNLMQSVHRKRPWLACLCLGLLAIPFDLKDSDANPHEIAEQGTTSMRKNYAVVSYVNQK